MQYNKAAILKTQYNLLKMHYFNYLSAWLHYTNKVQASLLNINIAVE